MSKKVEGTVEGTDVKTSAEVKEKKKKKKKGLSKSEKVCLGLLAVGIPAYVASIVILGNDSNASMTVTFTDPVAGPAPTPETPPMPEMV